MNKTVPFTKDDVKGYLDLVIRHWRKKRDDGGHMSEFAEYYIDAYQSVRYSLFDELLPPEDDARTLTEGDDD